jgi:hypothetical protein
MDHDRILGMTAAEFEEIERYMFKSVKPVMLSLLQLAAKTCKITMKIDEIKRQRLIPAFCILDIENA